MGAGVVVNYTPMTHPILARHANIVAAMSLRASPATWADRVVQVANEHQATVVVDRSPNTGVGLVTSAIREIAVSSGVVVPHV